MSKELSALRKLRPPDRRPETEKRVAAIRAALAVGHTQMEIAEALGVSRQRVSEIIKEHAPGRAA